MKTRLITSVIASSLSFTSCLTADDEHPLSNLKKVQTGIEAIIGRINPNYLHHHFTKEQAKTIYEWYAAGKFKYSDRFVTSDVSLNNILKVAIRHRQHDIADRVIELGVEHDVNIAPLIKTAIMHDHIDLLDRLLKIAHDRDTYYNYGIPSLLGAALKQNHISIDIIDRLLIYISDKDDMVLSNLLLTLDFDLILERLIKHGRIDIIDRLFLFISTIKPLHNVQPHLGFREHYDRHFGAGAYERKFGDVYNSYRESAGTENVAHDNYVDDPYATLGVSEDASPEAIKKAFRQLLLKHHPDKNAGDQEAAEKTRKIISAMKELRRRGKVK